MFDPLISSFQSFLLVFARIAGLLFVMPIFSSGVFLLRYRIIFALWLALAISPWAIKFIEVPDNVIWYGFLLLKEVLLGMIVGFFISLFFMILRMSSELFSIQIGLGFSQIFDPLTQTQVSLVGNFFYLITILLFFSIGGLHYSLKIITHSYKLLPLVDYSANMELIHNTVLRYFINMFRLAMQFALPIIGISILMTIVLSIIGKVAPQSNILILGLPLQYSMGMLLVFLLFPFILDLFQEIIIRGLKDIDAFVRALR